ncbi:hypothetical protein C6P45_004164 [Maudiozyma exigua]|uniref:Glycosyltransferase family 91 protein n=1 Tax=Maudiozyma exigua TaxID=34358 RepID=A0A9P7BBV0_MAUEX|nr:hypothetical protein C6P45_004164 [Kazachstania exigua]
MSPNLERFQQSSKFSEYSQDTNVKEQEECGNSSTDNSSNCDTTRINDRIINSRKSIILVYMFLLIILLLVLPQCLISVNVPIITLPTQLIVEDATQSDINLHDYRTDQTYSSAVTQHMITQKYSTSKLIGYSSLLQSKHLKDDTTCGDLSYHPIIEHSENKPILRDNLKSIRRELLQRSNHWLTKELRDKRDRYFSEDEIIRKQWFQFGGSSVWLEKEQCYLVFSRIVYSRLGRRNRPHVSLVRGQVFDKDWNEIIGKKIPYLDVKNVDIQQLSDIDDTILSRYYVTYPTVFDIPFGIDGDWNGPEDPHIILRKTNTTEEPIIFLNMFDTVEGKRRMFSFMPHRRIDSLIKLQIPKKILKKQEKNWSPFFHPSDLIGNVVSRGFVHFIYTFSPLDIIKCSLDDGICNIESSNKQYADRFDIIRGGSQFLSVPSSKIPGSIGKNIWVGFPKIHMSNCGCGEFFYRPMLVILSEIDSQYQIDLMLPIIDFNIDVLSWDMETTECKETNIMSPNSIIHWNIVSETQEGLYDDYMSLTISEADYLTKHITIKGIMNLVTGLYANQIQPGNNTKMEKLSISCSVDEAELQCSNYGHIHPKLKNPLMRFRSDTNIMKQSNYRLTQSEIDYQGE